MGVAHHSVYLVWCELGRTQHMRERGVTYRELEESGVRLPVVDAHLRFRAAARYDDVLSISSWVRECASRRVQFGNAIHRGETLLATALITLIAINESQAPITIPPDVRARLVPAPDPVRV
jgi:acyl-CoA thioester hydrolase